MTQVQTFVGEEEEEEEQQQRWAFNNGGPARNGTSEDSSLS